MKKAEKDMMIKVYSDQFKYFLLSGEKSDREYQLLQGQKSMLKLFFTDQEINRIENNIRVEKEYQKDYFTNIESWLKQIEREMGEKELLFSWDMKGLNRVYDHYDWLLNDEKYRGLKLAINNTMNILNKAA